MNKFSDYKDLIVWQKSIMLVKHIYQLTQRFPSEEKFGLVSQMRRSAVSIPSNIAEGQARRSSKEFAQFLSHAKGSAAELETQLIISKELIYCNENELNNIFELLIEIRKMLDALQRKLPT
jgi:four helix bundle protein